MAEPAFRSASARVPCGDRPGNCVAGALRTSARRRAALPNKMPRPPTPPGRPRRRGTRPAATRPAAANQHHQQQPQGTSLPAGRRPVPQRAAVAKRAPSARRGPTRHGSNPACAQIPADERLRWGKRSKATRRQGDRAGSEVAGAAQRGAATSLGRSAETEEPGQATGTGSACARACIDRGDQPLGGSHRCSARHRGGMRELAVATDDRRGGLATRRHNRHLALRPATTAAAATALRNSRAISAATTGAGASRVCCRRRQPDDRPGGALAAQPFARRPRPLTTRDDRCGPDPRAAMAGLLDRCRHARQCNSQPSPDQPRFRVGIRRPPPPCCAGGRRQRHQQIRGSGPPWGSADEGLDVGRPMA